MQKFKVQKIRKEQGNIMKMILTFFTLAYFVGAVTSAGCPDGWVTHDTSCYWFTTDKFTFDDAEHYCQQQHANCHLVQVETSEENTFIIDKLKGMHGAHRWMGLTDVKTEGTWEWVGSNTPASFTDWFPGQPNSNTGEEDCVIFTNYNSYRWYDVQCSSKYEPVCEIRTSHTIVG